MSFGTPTAVPFALYLISDRHQCAGRSLAETLASACAAGVRAVQIREKDLPAGELIQLIRDIERETAAFHPVILINDRADVAKTCHTAGVHLPESGLSPSLARQCLPDQALIGASTHSVDAALRAEANGVDFITFGPIFHTPSKAAFGEPQGLDLLYRVTRAVSVPVFAIGGITPERAIVCQQAGAAGVAVISAILAASDVKAAVAAFETALGGL